MFSVLLVPFIIAMFMAMNMGGSGTAPSFSAAYGSNIIRLDAIPGLFGIFVFLGAILAGSKVVKTLGKGILDPERMDITVTVIVLLSVSLALLLANMLKIPQSTSQATVFALMGPAAYFHALNSHRVFIEIVPTWFILPIISFAVTLIIAKVTYRPVSRLVDLKFIGLPEHRLFRLCVILGSCYVAFAIGSNNVANAAGPITTMIQNELGLADGSDMTLIMILSTLIVAPSFGIGSSIFGKRVVQTTGKEIVEFGPLGAMVIAVVTASLLLLASVSKGIPTSLVQLNAASIIALGIVKKGWKPMMSHRTLVRIFTVWIVAPFFALALSFSLTVLAGELGMIQTAWI
jgi:sulfate permease